MLHIREGEIMHFLNNISIKTKLFLVNVAIIIVTLSVLAYFSNDISSRAIIDKSVKSSARELALIDNNLQTMVNNIENYSRILSTDKELQKQLENYDSLSIDPLKDIDSRNELIRVLNGIVSPVTNLLAANIITTDRKIMAVGTVDENSLSSVIDRDFLDYVYEKAIPVWTGLFKIKLKSGNEEDVFAVAKSVIDFNSSRTLGAVVAYLPEREIASIYLENLSNKNAIYYILDKNGFIISSRNKDDFYKKFNEVVRIKDNEYEKVLNDENFITRFNEKEMLVTSLSFKPHNWKVINIIPMDEITTEKSQIIRIILVTGIFCLIFAFICSYLFSYTITKPILKLVETMKQIKLGNMDIRADFTSSDEIGMLSKGFNNLMDKIKSLMEEIYDQQKLRREYEFKLLQSQMNPHFLYNTIETIISFMRIGMIDKAIAASKYLAGFYRISLSKGNDIITIGEEYQLIENYLAIQKMRYFDYMDYELDFEKELFSCSIPKLTLQPLVENAIYHGLKQKEDKGVLKIRGYANDNAIEIEVFDNGVGMTEAKIRKVLFEKQNQGKNEDFGIGSVDARIKLLYGDRYGLRIKSEPGKFTVVTVMLPLKMD